MKVIEKLGGKNGRVEYKGGKSQRNNEWRMRGDGDERRQKLNGREKEKGKIRASQEKE